MIDLKEARRELERFKDIDYCCFAEEHNDIVRWHRKYAWPLLQEAERLDEARAISGDCIKLRANIEAERADFTAIDALANKAEAWLTGETRK